VLPEVSRSALDTIRGTVRVSVQVILDEAGTVVMATTDDPGPSRYFERRSLEAARKWTFAPTQTDEQRRMRLRFAFTRSGVSASAEPSTVAD
jgi:TonB family protein